MKVLRIDGRTAKVFVLKETDDSLVYIPVKSLFRYDYDIMVEMEQRGGELLKTMAKEVLPNGRNALVQYDSLIQVARYTDTEQTEVRRVRRPDEIFGGFVKDEVVVTKEQQAEPVKAEPAKPARRKPGPKPGTKRKSQAKA